MGKMSDHLGLLFLLCGLFPSSCALPTPYSVPQSVPCVSTEGAMEEKGGGDAGCASFSTRQLAGSRRILRAICRDTQHGQLKQADDGPGSVACKSDAAISLLQVCVYLLCGGVKERTGGSGACTERSRPAGNRSSATRFDKYPTWALTIHIPTAKLGRGRWHKGVVGGTAGEARRF